MGVESYTPYLNLLKFLRGHSVRDDDIGGNMDKIDAAVMGSVNKVSTTMVSLADTGGTPLYTVPTDKVFVPVMVVLRAGADAGTTTLEFGRVSARKDFLDETTLANINAAGDVAIMVPLPADTPVLTKSYAEDVVFQVNVATAAGGAENYVDLFGYLVDA